MSVRSRYWASVLLAAVLAVLALSFRENVFVASGACSVSGMRCDSYKNVVRSRVVILPSGACYLITGGRVMIMSSAVFHRAGNLAFLSPGVEGVHMRPENPKTARMDPHLEVYADRLAFIDIHKQRVVVQLLAHP